MPNQTRINASNRKRMPERNNVIITQYVCIIKTESHQCTNNSHVIITLLLTRRETRISPPSHGESYPRLKIKITSHYINHYIQKKKPNSERTHHTLITHFRSAFFGDTRAIISFVFSISAFNISSSKEGSVVSFSLIVMARSKL